MQKIEEIRNEANTFSQHWFLCLTLTKTIVLHKRYVCSFHTRLLGIVFSVTDKLPAACFFFQKEMVLMENKSERLLSKTILILQSFFKAFFYSLSVGLTCGRQEETISGQWRGFLSVLTDSVTNPPHGHKIQGTNNSLHTPNRQNSLLLQATVTWLHSSRKPGPPISPVRELRAGWGSMGLQHACCSVWRITGRLARRKQRSQGRHDSTSAAFSSRTGMLIFAPLQQANAAVKPTDISV